MQQTIKDKEEEKLKTNNAKTNSGYLRVMRLRQHFFCYIILFFLTMICMVWFSLNMGTNEHVLEGGHFYLIQTLYRIHYSKIFLVDLVVEII